MKSGLASNGFTSFQGIILNPNPLTTSLSSATMCQTLVKQGEAWGLDADFNTLTLGLTEFAVAYMVKFSSTLSDSIFQIGQSSGPHYVFSSTANGVIDGKFYKDASTPADSANNFRFTVPLDKFFTIAFDWVKDATSAVTLNVLISGVGKTSYTSIAGSTSPFQIPYGYMLFGKSVYAEFHSVYISKSIFYKNAELRELYSTGPDNISNKLTRVCDYDCYDDVCTESNNCVSSLILCLCPSTDCDSCTQIGRDGSMQCTACKSGFSFKNHHCCSNTLTNSLDCEPLSGTSSILCAEGYFLYDNGSGTTSCISCSDSCTSCNPNPQCFNCAKVITQDGSTCRVDSVGFQISFSSPNIIELDFASALKTGLTINSISAKTDSSSSTTIPTTGWTLNTCLAGAKQCTIKTDLTANKFPIVVDMAFNQV